MATFRRFGKHGAKRSSLSRTTFVKQHVWAIAFCCFRRIPVACKRNSRWSYRDRVTSTASTLPLMRHELRKLLRASVKPKPLLQNETVSARGCVFCFSRFALGNSVSRKNLVASAAALARAGCKVFGGRRSRRNARESDRDNNAPLAGGLRHWTCPGAPPRIADGALETVWR